MLSVIVCALLFCSSFSAGDEINVSTKCDHLGVGALLSMGLTPHFENEECPSFWTWPEQKVNTCFYQGKYYNNGEVFIKKDDNSEASCKCNVRKGNARIICDAANWTSTWEPLDMSYTCDENKYNGNQMFCPENTCIECKCTKEFKGEYVAPFCKRNNYDITMQYQKEVSKQCTPFYYNYINNEKPPLCSPSGFICDEDIFDIAPITEVKKTEEPSNKMCKLEQELYPIGTLLNVTFIQYNSKTFVNCTCSTPPIFTCVNTNIYNWIPEIAIDPLPYPYETDIIIADEVINPDVTSNENVDITPL